jgi:hypothetical protein
MIMKTSARSPSSSKLKSSNQEASSMALKRKKNTFRIETLLEFDERHVHPECIEKVEPLADVCIDIMR